MYILGVSAYYHDSAAALIHNEEILAAVQEERFTRVKSDSNFPVESIKYCLEEAKIGLEQIDYVVFYDKPFLKFERLLETYLAEAPAAFPSFMKSIPVWLKQKLFLKETMTREFKSIYKTLQPSATSKSVRQFKKSIFKKLRFCEHHNSHAASAFFPSSYTEAAILTMDGVGEWTTTSLAYGNGNSIKFLQEIMFPHSLGLLYSAFTYYLGFKVNSGEYKVMGLAPYGEPIYADLIKEHLIDVKDDGSFKLNMIYFNYTIGSTMTNSKFNELFGAPPRESESELTQREMDIAASLQQVTEEVVIKLARYAQKETGSKNLCLAGGVALNCVANGKLLSEKIFENIWVQPAAGDAGGAIGAAYAYYYQDLKQVRNIDTQIFDKMKGSFLGPKYSSDEVKQTLDSLGANYTYIEDEDVLMDLVSTELANTRVVGWHHDRMEFGPRSLGHRSILADPKSNEMHSKLNLKIKFRESFRPFAPSILKEDVSEWYEVNIDSPYMLFVGQIKEDKCFPVSAKDTNKFGMDKLNVNRSKVPAVTHVDYSARVQTVEQETNPRFYKLLTQFKQKTACPILINTSFNVRGEPIVCSPKDSFICFMHTGIDVLVIDDFILFKEEQVELAQHLIPNNAFTLD